jgi:hypothetical protein
MVQCIVPPLVSVSSTQCTTLRGGAKGRAAPQVLDVMNTLGLSQVGRGGRGKGSGCRVAVAVEVEGAVAVAEVALAVAEVEVAVVE